MRESSAKEPCPGCDGEKLKSSLLCFSCRKLAQTQEDHPNWKGGKYDDCPRCGGQKLRQSKSCRSCFGTRFEDGVHVNAREWQKTFRKTPTGKKHVRSMNLKKYGLTVEEYDVMVSNQGGVCASCKRVETHRNQFGVVSLAVDHDHETGEVRGLLCGRCNRALGLLWDDVKNIENLMNYRKGYK